MSVNGASGTSDPVSFAACGMSSWFFGLFIASLSPIQAEYHFFWLNKRLITRAV